MGTANITETGSRVYFKQKDDGTLIPREIALSRPTTLIWHDGSIDPLPEGDHALLRGDLWQMEPITRYDVVAWSDYPPYSPD